MAKAKTIEAKKVEVKAAIPVKILVANPTTYDELTDAQKRWYGGLMDDLGEAVHPSAVAKLHPTVAP